MIKPLDQLPPGISTGEARAAASEVEDALSPNLNLGFETAIQAWRDRIIRLDFRHYGSWVDMAAGFALGLGYSPFHAGMFTAEVMRRGLIPEPRNPPGG